jgi:TonB-linked SusC/RagA family outer membrane protein
MNKKKNKIRFFISVCVALFCTALSAQEDIRTEEKVNLGYFTQTKESNTGAIATVTGAELEKSPVSSLSQTLAGRLLGLTTIENSAELTGVSVTKLIRGISTINGTEPLVIIDGIICPNTYYDYLIPKEIESISILKDASSTAIYGIQGSNGAIVITTKRGYVGKKKIDVYFDQSVQQMTKRPEFLGSPEYVALRNQAGVNDGLDAFSQFSRNDVDGFSAGDNSLYPNNNWYGIYVNELTMMQRAGFNLTGGSERIRFFSNVNYLHQSTPFKVSDEPNRKYDPTPGLHGVNFRANLDLTLNNYLSAFLRLSGNVAREQQTQHRNTTIYNKLFSLPPTMYGSLTPPDETNPEAGNQVVTHDAEDYPVYGMLNRSGYARQLKTNVMTQAGLTLDMGFLTQGLSATGLMAYQTYANNITNTFQNFERYVRSNDYSVLQFSKKGTNENTPLAYSKSALFFYNLNLSAHADYKRTFGDHSIDAMAYIFYMKQEKELTLGASMLPYKRESMGVTALYGYRNRYFVKGDIGYSGSEQFHPDYRYLATPAISAAWIVSNEDFLSGNTLLSYLKLRASYGISANDQLGDARFLYLDYMDINGNEGLRGNPKLTAEKIKNQNYGIEVGFLNAISLSFDYFRNRCDNMLVNSSAKIPIYQGTLLDYYPKLNNGQMENKGFEVELGYDKQIGKDLNVFAKAGLSKNQNKVIRIGEAPAGENYAYRYRTEGYATGQLWGLLIDKSNGNGMYNSAEELRNYGLTYSHGTPRVGDFIYYDLNSDGVIDEKDYAPIGYSNFPQQYFNFSAGLNYKNLEVNVLFQGVNRTSFFLSGIGAYEYQAQGIFNDIHLNAWTPERYAAGEEITFPALSLSQSTNHVANSYFLQNGAYLRLKNAEIAYTLPSSIARKIAAEKIRIALTGMNLLTFDKLRTKYVDPEIKSMDAFQSYRVYNIGINLTF